MKRNFQLTALAFALAATSGMAMADVFSIVDTDDTLSGNVFNTYTINTDGLNSVTANTITSNGNVSAAGTVAGASLTDGTATMTGGTLSSSNSLGITSTFNNVNISAGNDANVSALSSVNLVVDSNDGGFGAFTVVKGVAAPTTLITSDVNGNGGTVINTNTTVNGNLNATTVAASGISTSALEVNGNAIVTGTLTANSVNIINTNSSGVPNTSTSKSGISTTQKYNAGMIAGITDDVYKITEQDPNSGVLTDKFYTRNAITGNYTKVELTPSQEAALPFTGNKTGPTTNLTKIEDVDVSKSIINGQKVDFSNNKTRDTTVDIKGQLVQIDTDGNPVGLPESANGQALSQQVDLEGNRAAIGILDKLDVSGKPIPNSNYYGVNTVKTVYDEPTKTRISGDTTIAGDSIALTSTTTVDDTLTETKTTSINASGITTGRINGNGNNGALVLHGGTNSTTQTLDDNGISFITTNAAGDTTGTTTIGADGTLTVKGINVTQAIDDATADRAVIRNELVAGDAATLVSANQTTADTATAIRGELTAGDAATLASANQTTADTATAIRSELTAGDAATLASANATTANTATAVRTEFAAADTVIRNAATAETARVNSAISTGDAATLASANATTANTATAVRTEFAAADTVIRNAATAETARVNTAISTGDAATLASATQNTADTAVAIRSEAATESARVNTAITDGDAATLASANQTTATTATAVRTEFAAADTAIRNAATAETARVNTAISTGNATTLASSKAYTDTSSATTLAAANTYTDSRANQMNHRLDDVEKTAYRGVAIALAAQQAIPNLKPGNFAVYGGIGHYEGENAGALGVATLLGNGRTSINAAFGFASSQVGGRVGVSYVFGD